MRLDEPIDSTGEFWVLGSDDDKVPGTLRIAQNGEVTLELSGALSGLAAFVRHRRPGRYFGGGTEEHPTRLLGVIRDGGAVTLDGCLPPIESFELLSGLAASVIHANVAYIGVWYDEEQIAFQEISCSLEGLEVWLGTESIENEFDHENNEGIIRYRIPDEIPLLIPNGIDAKFVFGLIAPSFAVPITEASIKQTVHLSFKLPKVEPTAGCWSLASRFCTFLSLALNRDVGVQSMTGYVDAQVSDIETQRRRVRIYVQSDPPVGRKQAIRRRDALFLYENVADRIATLIANWLNMYETFGDAISLYFDSKNRATEYLERQVLWLAQALETLHRKSSDETSMPKEEFLERLESILERCSQDERSWLQDKLRYANELSFRARLRKLVEYFGDQFGSGNERKTFIDMVYDTRNYLTHYDERTTPNRAVEPGGFFDLREKMEALFQLHLLLHTGFERSEIGTLAENNYSLRRKLRSAAR